MRRGVGVLGLARKWLGLGSRKFLENYHLGNGGGLRHFDVWVGEDVVQYADHNVFVQ